MQLEELLGKAQRIELKSRHLARSHYSGLYRSAFKGQGLEFADVREYSDGDDMRLIDWNVSARSQTLYVKKMVEERERNVLLVLDRSGSLRFGSIRRTKYDLLVELASLFVLSAFLARDRVSLALFGERVDAFVPPAKGWNHAARLVREMVSVRPQGPSDDMEPLWGFLTSPGVPRSLVLLLMDFQAPLVASNSFSVACRKHEIVAVLVSDPREWSLPRAGRIRLEHPETGDVRVVNTNSRELRDSYEKRAVEKRGKILQTLASNRVDWVEFSTAAEYEVPLRRFLESRAAKRGYRRL